MKKAFLLLVRKNFREKKKEYDKYHPLSQEEITKFATLVESVKKRDEVIQKLIDEHNKKFSEEKITLKSYKTNHKPFYIGENEKVMKCERLFWNTRREILIRNMISKKYYYFQKCTSNWIPGTCKKPNPEYVTHHNFLFDNFDQLKNLETKSEEEQKKIIDFFLPYGNEETSLSPTEHRKEFLHFLEYFSNPQLNKLFQSFKKPEEKNLELKNRRLLKEWTYTRLFDLKSSFEKRKLEKLNFAKLDHTDYFYKLGRNSKKTEELFVPLDIMKLIISFMTIGKEFLDTFGLVNEKFYLLALSSFEEFLITEKNVDLIPVPVFRNLKMISIDVSRKLYSKDIRRMFQETKELKVLQIFQHVIKFLNALNACKQGISFPKVVALCIDSYPKDFDYKKIEEDMFPNIKAFECKLESFKKTLSFSRKKMLFQDSIQCLILNGKTYQIQGFLKMLKEYKELKELHFNDQIVSNTYSKHDPCGIHLEGISRMTITEELPKNYEYFFNWNNSILFSSCKNIKELTIKLSLVQRTSFFSGGTFSKCEISVPDLSLFPNLEKFVVIESNLVLFLGSLIGFGKDDDLSSYFLSNKEKIKQRLKKLGSRKNVTVIAVQEKYKGNMNLKAIDQFLKNFPEVYDIQTKRNWEIPGKIKIGEEHGRKICISRKYSHLFFKKSYYSEFKQ